MLDYYRHQQNRRDSSSRLRVIPSRNDPFKGFVPVGGHWTGATLAYVTIYGCCEFRSGSTYSEWIRITVNVTNTCTEHSGWLIGMYDHCSCYPLSFLVLFFFLLSFFSVRLSILSYILIVVYVCFTGYLAIYMLTVCIHVYSWVIFGYCCAVCQFFDVMHRFYPFAMEHHPVSPRSITECSRTASVGLCVSTFPNSSKVQSHGNHQQEGSNRGAINTLPYHFPFYFPT